MDISSIIGGFTGQSLASQSAQQSATDPITAAFNKAGNRIEQQIGTTQVQLSAFGQIKGAFAELQSASKAVSNPQQTATADDLKAAIGNFVAAYNKTNKVLGTATQAAQGQSTTAGALSGDNRARLAGNDLTRAVGGSSTLASLKSVGVVQNKDGSLALDNKALDNALKANPDQVRNVFATVGTQVEKTASAELANNGNVGASVNALSKRNAVLVAQQSAQQDQQVAAQRQLDKQSALVNNVFASGVAAYQRTFAG